MSENNNFPTNENYATGRREVRRGLFRGIVPIIVILVLVFGCLGIILSWSGEAASVVQENFGPNAAVERYEWFKDAAAQLGAKRQNIQNYEQELAQLEADYHGEPRSAWDRTDKESQRDLSSRIVGVKAAYNNLAAEYNANMAKINYRYANIGEVPAGEETLSREFRDYQ